jgi:hypothetical protein
MIGAYPTQAKRNAALLALGASSTRFGVRDGASCTPTGVHAGPGYLAASARVGEGAIRSGVAGRTLEDLPSIAGGPT